MTEREQKKAMQEFANFWHGKGYEKGQSQPFWLSLLRALGVEHPESFIEFEDKVHLAHDSFIDGMIPATRVMIEQKSLGKDLSKPIKQSDGSLLTPFQQAKRYISELPVDEHPRYVITCNFAEFWVYDMNQPQGEPQIVKLEDLPREYYRLQFLVETKSVHLQKELEVSIKAGELVGKLYDALRAQYLKPDSEHSLKSLNVLCVRLVFCLYAEDAGIFGGHSKFHDYLLSFREKNMRRALMDLFKVLNQKPEERDPYMDDDLVAFPYVNGGLFADETVEIPRFTDEIIELLLKECSEDFDWSAISPTIFGAVFESTLNPGTRRSGGMHYTSIENIHKVIDPLFLDDLKIEFAKIKAMKAKAPKEKQVRNQKLDEFQSKLANLKFLDPACGSGNFLTETYLSLRRLENEAIALRNQNSIVLGGLDNPIQVSISQFYGIEINDFAVTVAKTALWIAESQMMKETEDIVNMTLDFLPLKTNAYIIEGNALRLDWQKIVPANELKYIMGNPPFVGARNQSAQQKEDIQVVCVTANNQPIARSKFIDYVGGWYFKTAQYIQHHKIRCAFVSTNSICQGEQVELIWKNLQEEYHIQIIFAYRSFVWDSESNNKAHVHCVIIGFAIENPDTKYLWFSEKQMQKVNHINGYLLNAPDCYLQRLRSSLMNAPKMSNGNRAYDGNNLILTRKEKDELIAKEPMSKQFIKPYYMGVDLIQGNPRYVIWLAKADVSVIRKLPMIMARIKAVKEMRLASKSKSTQKAAETPTLFQTICQPDHSYLAFPRVSSQRRKYIPMTFLSSDDICGDKLIIIPEATIYHFGILMSNVHNAWMRVVSGRLKSDFEYSSGVYNNFPWPIPTDAQRQRIEQTAQGILDARALYPDASLADLYDQLTMPHELRKAHQENDKAVMNAYGFDWRHMTESDCVAALMKLYQQLIATKS